MILPNKLPSVSILEATRTASAEDLLTIASVVGLTSGFAPHATKAALAPNAKLKAIK